VSVRLGFSLFPRIVKEDFQHLEDCCAGPRLEKRLRAPVATLRDAVRDAGEDGAGKASHGWMLRSSRRVSN